MIMYYSHAADENDGTRKGTKLLKLHLQEVGNSVEKLITQLPTDSILLVPDIGYCLGIAHDFGKYTTYFQDYLLNGVKDSQLRHHHGFISAIFAAYLVDNLLKLHGSHYNKYLTLLAYFVVLHHHGDLNALELDIVKERDLQGKDFITIAEPFRSKLKALQYQIDNIGEKLFSIEAEYSELLNSSRRNDVKIKGFLTSWRGILSTIYKLQYQLVVQELEETRLKVFTTLLFLYSLLIDADKKDAADVADIKRKYVPGDLVDRYRESSQYIDTKGSDGITGIRNEIYASVVKRIVETPLTNHIFTLTAPTGTGKTLSSFSCALKLRERLTGQPKGYYPRIIYSLPFTSIIDQNYTVLKEVLSQIPDFEQNENVYLLKHHHLADLRYKADDEERPLSESLLLIESWESEIIVTTFIQFLHTIIGFKNRFLKKYHNIAGSIILLDEVQNIPVEYWPLINRVFKMLVEYLGCYIVLLTATKPLIFDENESIPLLVNSEKYFTEKGLNRITLIPDSKSIKLDEFFQKVKKLYEKSNSHLVVLNTIKSSITFYKMIREDDLFKGLVKKKNIFYLSTNIVPRERESRIKSIKGLLNRGEKIFVVATQVVEAGVDIDFDIVIRDIGPIDSIIQVAGRCNRNMGDKKGKVYIFNLSDKNCSYAQYVYGKTHFIISHKLLDSNSLEEDQFYGLINQYFSEVTQRQNQDSSQYIWDAILNYRFYHPNMKSISDFELIKEKHGYVDVFIEVDENAKQLLSRYIREVVKEKDFRKRQNNYLMLRKDFNSYIISIPRNLSIGLNNINEFLLMTPYEQLSIYYEDDAGFKRVEDGSLIF